MLILYKNILLNKKRKTQSNAIGDKTVETEPEMPIIFRVVFNVQ